MEVTLVTLPLVVASAVVKLVIFVVAVASAPVVAYPANVGPNAVTAFAFVKYKLVDPSASESVLESAPGTVYQLKLPAPSVFKTCPAEPAVPGKIKSYAVVAAFAFIVT